MGQSLPEGPIVVSKLWLRPLVETGSLPDLEPEALQSILACGSGRQSPGIPGSAWDVPHIDHAPPLSLGHSLRLWRAVPAECRANSPVRSTSILRRSRRADVAERAAFQREVTIATGRVLIVEDQRIVREGLQVILQSCPGLEIVGGVGDGQEAIKMTGALRPNLVLMDISMPGITGIDSAGEIKKRYPDTKVIVLTIHSEQEYLQAALEAGANGYVLKDATTDELITAIQQVLQGRTYLSARIQDALVDGYRRRATTPEADTLWRTLTQRERQVLKLVAEAHTNKEIAGYLCISVKTVEKHRANLMSKLNLRNAAALTAYALSKRVIDS